MPVFLRIRGYKVYFWSNESHEPIHFHIAEGDPSPNDTKVWIHKDKTFQVANNKGQIPDKNLIRIMIIMHSYVDDYIRAWESHIGQVRYIR